VAQAHQKKKIIGLSCGTPNGNCESFIKEAAMGAEEFGIETEIIRAQQLKVLPCRGCMKCSPPGQTPHTGKCVIKDDVQWILEKTVLGDDALIVAAPVYYLRSNGYFMSICERMHPIMFNHLEILKQKKVGAIISVGGSPPDWTNLGLIGMNIWTQHFIKLVDQMQVGLMMPNVDWYARARELGRNVARAMNMPIEEVKYVGPKPAVSCPVCHCDILQVFDKLPNVVCPICWVHGVIFSEGGEMRVKWDEWDVKYPRFSEYGVKEHMRIGPQGKRLKFPSSAIDRERDEFMSRQMELKKKYRAYGKIIKPPVKS
jgi:multimeric flavodoxin WrbA